MVGSVNGNSYQTSIPTQMTQKLFSMIDADGDGSISKTELQSLSDQEGSGIEAFFGNADSDESDAVTQQEFASALSKIFQEIKGGSDEGRPAAGGPPPPDSSGMISSMDTDGDGYLSVDEMSAGGVRDAEKLFSEIDTDGDGLAGQDELEAFAETMAAEGPKEMAGSPPPPPLESSDGDSEPTTSLQQEFLGKIVEMIAQNKGYSDFGVKGTSIFA